MFTICSQAIGLCIVIRVFFFGGCINVKKLYFNFSYFLCLNLLHRILFSIWLNMIVDSFMNSGLKWDLFSFF